MYEVITYGGGSVLNGIFEAIARMRGVDAVGSVFSGLIVIAVLCAYIQTVLGNMMNTNIKATVIWMVGWSIFLSLMYVQTVTVNIVDKTLNQQKIVANVPFGLALFASLSSQVSDFLTEEFETQFNVPDDFRSYRRSGTLFSEALVTTASRFEIANPRVERNFRNFARQCILYDVRIGNRYSLEELVYADNAWELIRTQTSTLRMFDYQDIAGVHQVKTCRLGAVDLNTDLTAEATRNAAILSWRFFSKSSTDVGADIFSLQKSHMVRQIIQDQLGPAHTFLTNMAGDATSILKQHIVRNAIKDSVIKNAEIVGATAAAQGFAVARAQEQQRNTFQILGALSGKALANLTIVFQAILYGSFMLIVLLVIQPNGFQFLKKYLGLVLWVQSWPPLFALINYIQTEELRSASIAAATYVDGNGTIGVGWNLFTSPAIIQANLDIAAFAGFYSISVPVIAISLVQGVQSFLTLASHLGAVTQGSASHAGEEMTSGNYSFGNINLDNYSANNTNANHWNTSTSYSGTRSDWELSSGSTLSEMADGSRALNQLSGSSQLMTSFRLSDMYSASVQQQSQRAESALYNDSVALASGIVDTASKALHLAKNAGSTHSEGTHHQYGEHGSVADALNKQKVISQKLMDEYGVNEDQSVQLMVAAGIDLGKELNGSTIPSNIASSVLATLGAKLAFSVGLKGSAASSASAQEAVKRAQDLMTSEGATHSIDTIVRAAKDGHFNTGTDKQARLSEDFRSSLDKTHRQEQSYQASLQKMESLQETASFLKSSSGNIEQNLQQFTLEKIADLKDSSGNRLGEAKADQILKDPSVAKPYIEAIAEDSFKELTETYKQHAISKADLEQHHRAQTDSMNNPSLIEKQHAEQQNEIIEQSKAVGLTTYDDTVISNKNQEQAEKLLKNNKDELQAKEGRLTKESNKFKEQTNEKLNLHKKGLTRRAFSNAVKRTFNQDDKK